MKKKNSPASSVGGSMLSDILLLAVLTSMIRMSTSCPSEYIDWMFSDVTERSGLRFAYFDECARRDTTWK